MESGDSLDLPKRLKRQRVTAACQRCHQLKAKCNGVKPSCERCVAYGFECVWTRERLRKSNDQQEQQSTIHTLFNTLTTSTIDNPHSLVRALVNHIQSGLDLQDSQQLQQTIGKLTDQLQPAHEASPASLMQSPGAAITVETYLGETSEGDFIRTTGQGSCDCEGTRVDPSSIDRSYDLVGTVLTQSCTLPPPQLSRAAGMKYVELFVSTIGIAYPFVPPDDLKRAVLQWFEPSAHASLSSNWQSLILAISAIGACYDILTGEAIDIDASNDRVSHTQLYQQSLDVATKHEHIRDIERVWARLAHCFYLLATTQIDGCWRTLGNVVRLSHSIGLHTGETVIAGEAQVEYLREQRRTTWYCVYVLDHLLALQLGRPPATYTPFFHVNLPQTIFGTQGGISLSEIMDIPLLEVEYSVHSYLLAMVSLSNMIEEVLSTLYSPRRIVQVSRSDIISQLDQKLVHWKTTLPRVLRFDLGHTFETCSLHRRHRNFLAIKFHHLRSLIHRPCLSYLKQDAAINESAITTSALPPAVQNSIMTCISSAQSTARLLYNVENKERVVHDFPWWQMISCLICASSILLVAVMDRDLSSTYDTQSIEGDAEICMEVFKALSVNSKAAKAALDMMKGLQATKSCASAGKSPCSTDPAGPQEDHESSVQATPQSCRSAECSQSAVNNEVGGITSRLLAPEVSYQSHNHHLISGAIWDPSGADNSLYDMGDMMSDPLLWSTQFIGDEFNPSSSIGFWGPS